MATTKVNSHTDTKSTPALILFGRDDDLSLLPNAVHFSTHRIGVLVNSGLMWLQSTIASLPESALYWTTIMTYSPAAGVDGMRHKKDTNMSEDRPSNLKEMKVEMIPLDLKKQIKSDIERYKAMLGKYKFGMAKTGQLGSHGELIDETDEIARHLDNVIRELLALLRDS